MFPVDWVVFIQWYIVCALTISLFSLHQERKLGRLCDPDFIVIPLITLAIWIPYVLFVLVKGVFPTIYKALVKERTLRGPR